MWFMFYLFVYLFCFVFFFCLFSFFNCFVYFFCLFVCLFILYLFVYLFCLFILFICFVYLFCLFVLFICFCIFGLDVVPILVCSEALDVVVTDRRMDGDHLRGRGRGERKGRERNGEVLKERER